MKDYTKLKSLLEAEETFPLHFKFKFIGRNTPGFAVAVQNFERAHPTIQLEQSRESSGGNHLAMTYLFVAPDASSIIAVYQVIEKLTDLMVVL